MIQIKPILNGQIKTSLWKFELIKTPKQKKTLLSKSVDLIQVNKNTDCNHLIAMNLYIIS